MPLVLEANPETVDDYRVMHGKLEVGQIYKRKAALRAEAQWLWALNTGRSPYIANIGTSGNSG
jgi:hypothetical protein